SVRLIQCGLLLFFLMFSNYLGLPMKNFACGIAFGFGIFATGDMLIFSLKSQMSMYYHGTISVLSSALYNISVLVWLGYSMLPETANKRLQLQYQPLFDRWNQAAMTVMSTHTGGGTQRVAMDHTYLSDIEQVVDNVLRRDV